MNEFTRRLKAELNQTEHLNIYEVPCPSCGAAFVSSAKVRDDPRALSYCSAGHEFTRAQAFEAYNASVRAQVKINASARLLQAEYLSDYLARLEKMGIKRIGRGAFSTVFQHPTLSDVVVKVVRSDPGYFSYLEFCKTRNPYCPQVISVHDVKLENLPAKIVFLEKLRPANASDYQRFVDHVIDITGETKLNKVSTWSKLSKQSGDSDLAKLAKYIVGALKQNRSLELDMRLDNFMTRGSHIVINDPFTDK